MCFATGRIQPVMLDIEAAAMHLAAGQWISRLDTSAEGKKVMTRTGKVVRVSQKQTKKLGKY
jgi:hypothetical protein